MTPADFEKLCGRNAVDVIVEITGLPRKPLLQPAELGELLNLGRTRLYAELKAGRIPARRIGGRYAISTAALALWLLDIEQDEGGDA